MSAFIALSAISRSSLRGNETVTKGQITRGADPGKARRSTDARNDYRHESKLAKPTVVREPAAP